MSTKKSPYTKFCQWCLDECWRIQESLHLTEYRITIDEQPTEFEDRSTAFQICTIWPYKTANLKWGVFEFEQWKKDKISTTRYLLHEVLHLIVEPLAHIANKRYCTDEERRDCTESVVDRLTNILAAHFTK